MIQNVSDIRANGPEAIVHAAKAIGKSKDRIKVFEIIYGGQKKVKTAEEIAKHLLYIKEPNQRYIRVLNRAKELSSDHIIESCKDKKTQKMGFMKVPFYAKHRDEILTLVKNPARIKKMITKRNPSHANEKYAEVRVTIPGRLEPIQVTIDDIDTFKLVRKSDRTFYGKNRPKEETIKLFFKKISGESGTFKDWGGEKNDLYTTKFKLNNRRISTAIAFKGRATTGKLTPEKMGKRGDQIERLFSSPADLFLVVYDGQIDQSILAQMKAFALTKSFYKQKVYYGIIDKDDLEKLFGAYPDFIN